MYDDNMEILIIQSFILSTNTYYIHTTGHHLIEYNI